MMRSLSFLLALGWGASSFAQSPPTVVPGVTRAAGAGGVVSSMCPNGSVVTGEDAAELAKSLKGDQVQETKGDVVVTKTEVKTAAGTTLSCEIYTDKMSGKTVQNFESRKPTCTFTPAVAADAGSRPGGNPAAAPPGGRAGGHRIQQSGPAPH